MRASAFTWQCFRSGWFIWFIGCFLLACIYPASHCACAKSLQSGPTLCDPMDCSPPDSSVHGILQARELGWIAISYFMTQGSNPRLLALLHWQVGPLPLAPPGNPLSTRYIPYYLQFSSVAQSCPTLCDPMNCSTPGLPVHH